MIKRLIYQLGVKWRNPSLMEHFTFLKKSDNWSLEQLKQYQFDRCKELLHFAYEHSPFYKQYFDLHGFNPKAFTSIDDLKKLPVLRKPTLITNENDIQSTYPFKKLFASKTSGTSGTTLNFRKDESWDSFNRAGLYRGWYWYGIQPWTKKGYLSGFSLAKTALWKLKFQDFLQNRSRNYSFADDDIVRFLKKIKNVEYVHGYASMIYEVAKKAEALGLAGQFNFKAIFGTSEKIFDNYQDTVKRVFGKKIVSEYGAAETGIIAMECPEGNMHITIENCLIEVEDNEIIVTNFMSKSFPFIRYSLGDEIVLAPENFKCACGRAHPVLKEVTGRVGFNFIGHEKEFPNSSFSYLIRRFEKEHHVVLNFQVLQHKKGELIINLEQELGDLKTQFLHFLEIYYGDDFEFEVHTNVALQTMDGKFKDYISTLET